MMLALGFVMLFIFPPVGILMILVALVSMAAKK
jgi:hypothetical protein